MSTLLWGDVLNGAEANKGSQPLNAGDYNFKVASAEGKTAQSGREMISVRLEVLDGPYAGRTAWHNWVLPLEADDKAKTSMGYFLGDMEVFGLTKEWFGQNLGGQPITKSTCDFIGSQLVNQVVTATVAFQRNDPSRNDIKKFRALEATGGVPAAGPGAGFPAVQAVQQQPAFVGTQATPAFVPQGPGNGYAAQGPAPAFVPAGVAPQPIQQQAPAPVQPQFAQPGPAQQFTPPAGVTF